MAKLYGSKASVIWQGSCDEVEDVYVSGRGILAAVCVSPVAALLVTLVGESMNVPYAMALGGAIGAASGAAVLWLAKVDRD